MDLDADNDKDDDVKAKISKANHTKKNSESNKKPNSESKKGSKSKKNDLKVPDDSDGILRSFWRIMRAIFIIDENYMDKKEYDIDELDQMVEDGVEDEEPESFSNLRRKSRKLLSVVDEDNDDSNEINHENDDDLKEDESYKKRKLLLNKYRKEPGINVQAYSDELESKPAVVKGAHVNYLASKPAVSKEKVARENLVAKPAKHQETVEIHIKPNENRNKEKKQLNNLKEELKQKLKAGAEHKYRISNLNKRMNGDDDDDENEDTEVEELPTQDPNTFLIGRYRIDKTKLGNIGYEYRYRVSRKLEALLFEHDKNVKHKKIRKGSNPNTIIDVLEYSDDEEIPFCDALKNENENFEELKKAIKFADKVSSTPESEEKVTSNVDPWARKEKPKAGPEHMYRISRMLADKNYKPQAKILEKIEKPKKVVDPWNNKEKPKAGTEHMYRINRMLTEKKSNNKSKKVIVEVSKQVAKSSDAQVDPWANKEKPKAGPNHMYRISRMLADVSFSPLSEIEKKVFEKKVAEKKAFDPWANKEKPKAGPEHMYRIRKMKADKEYLKNLKKTKKTLKQNEDTEKDKTGPLDPWVNKEKPKAGPEHMYRISKRLADKDFRHEDQKIDIVEKPKKGVEPCDPWKNKGKPKAGLEHMYRLSRLKADKSYKQSEEIKLNRDNKSKFAKEPIVEKKEADPWANKEKPKAGQDKMYRISKKLAEKEIQPMKIIDEKVEKLKKVIEPVDPWKNKEKPNAGPEHMYRISIMKANKVVGKKLEKKFSKSDAVDKKVKSEKYAEKVDPWANKQKPKVGPEHMYRISNMMADMKGEKINLKKSGVSDQIYSYLESLVNDETPLFISNVVCLHIEDSEVCREFKKRDQPEEEVSEEDVEEKKPRFKEKKPLANTHIDQLIMKSPIFIANVICLHTDESSACEIRKSLSQEEKYKAAIEFVDDLFEKIKLPKFVSNIMCMHNDKFAMCAKKNEKLSSDDEEAEDKSANDNVDQSGLKLNFLHK